MKETGDVNLEVFSETHVETRKIQEPQRQLTELESDIDKCIL